MRTPTWLLPLLAALALAPTRANAHTDLLQWEVLDRETGLSLPAHAYRGERWVAGTPGHRYALRLRNLSGERVLAVVSVDGVNVVTGASAATSQAPMQALLTSCGVIELLQHGQKFSKDHARGTPDACAGQGEIRHPHAPECLEAHYFQPAKATVAQPRERHLDDLRHLAHAGLEVRSVLSGRDEGKHQVIAGAHIQR